jgi:phage recombination protein Bet
MSNIEEFSKFSKADIEAARNMICKEAPDEIIRLILHRCSQLGCDPLARMIYAVLRKGKWQLQSSIDLFRSIASADADYGGQDGPFWCGQDGIWHDVWLSKEKPAAAKVGVYRKGFSAPTYAVANWDAYAVTGDQGFMWNKMPALMLAKTAEALALRKAFPQKLAGLYTNDEMAQADNGKAIAATPLPVVAQGAQVHTSGYMEPVALQAATVAPKPRVDQDLTELQVVRLLGKQMGLLEGSIQANLKNYGGDVLALKAEYENALSQKNPRAGHSEPTTVAAPVIKVENNSVSNNGPAVDGEAGTYPMWEVSGFDSAEPRGIDISATEAPASEKTQAVMAVMTHAGFEKALPEYSQKMAFCSSVTSKSITAWSQLTPVDCANILARLNTEYKSEPGGSLATDSEIVQLQIHLKDADFVAMLKKSRTYREAQEAEQTQADSLRAARLAYAGSILKHPVASFKELTSAEIQTLFAALKK